MLSRFTLDDVCETLVAFPASVAVFVEAPGDRFLVRAVSVALEGLLGATLDRGSRPEIDDLPFDDGVRGRFRAACIRCRDTRAEVTVDDEVTGAHGARLCTSTTVVPLLAPSGEVRALIATIVDITDLVVAREALVRRLASTASGFTTVCAWCRSIREDDVWIPLDRYLGEHPESDIVLCADCRSAEGG